MKVITKLGRTVAAGGGSPVPGFGQPGDSNAQSGSGLQVGADENRARPLQGSGGIVCVPTGGAGHKATTKAGTGDSRFGNVPAARKAWLPAWKRANAALGELSGRTVLA